jgi:hypothetical protein
MDERPIVVVIVVPAEGSTWHKLAGVLCAVALVGLACAAWWALWLCMQVLHAIGGP